ncbi:MAG: acetolactate synthase large subunit, partial [Myxococcota bacterium]
HLVRDAFRIAEEEKPGPVHLEVPEDVAAEEVDRLPFTVTEVLPPGASQTALQRAADLIQAARRPLVCVAAAANRPKTMFRLEEFFDQTGLYFVTTQMGKGAVDERHRQFIGTTALSEGDYVHDAVNGADVILMIGHDLSEKPPFLMRRGGRTVIHMNHDPAGMDDVYFPQLEVLGCTAANVSSLAERVSPAEHWDDGFFSRIKQLVDEHVFERPAAASFPLTPARVVDEVREALPSDGIVSLDNGIYKVWFAREYRAHCPNTLLLDNALATMGAGLPAAIGAQFVYPDRQVVAICGDGGLMMNAQELETAVRRRLNLSVVVLRDDAYGMIRWKQAAMGLPDFGLGFGNPDFVAYAQAYGATGHRVEAAGELRAGLVGARAAGGVHVVDVPVDYSDNQRVLIDELRDKPSVEPEKAK